MFLRLITSYFKGSFAEQSYYKEAIELIKGYKPIMEKLVEPVVFKKLDMSDSFQYHDGKRAQVDLIFQ
jgi:hypothetical protein